MDIETANLTIKYVLISRLMILDNQIEMLYKIEPVNYFFSADHLKMQKELLIIERNGLKSQLKFIGDGGYLNYHK